MHEVREGRHCRGIVRYPPAGPPANSRRSSLLSFSRVVALLGAVVFLGGGGDGGRGKGGGKGGREVEEARASRREENR